MNPSRLLTASFIKSVDFLIYAPLVDNLGMSKLKVAYTAGEAIGPEIFEFYRSLGSI